MHSFALRHRPGRRLFAAAAPKGPLGLKRLGILLRLLQIFNFVRAGSGELKLTGSLGHGFAPNHGQRRGRPEKAESAAKKLTGIGRFLMIERRVQLEGRGLFSRLGLSRGPKTWQLSKTVWVFQVFLDFQENLGENQIVKSKSLDQDPLFGKSQKKFFNKNGLLKFSYFNLAIIKGLN
jgi:hypothetical protein